MCRVQIPAVCGAGGNRTHKTSRPADFKSAASANSATAPTALIVSQVGVKSRLHAELPGRYTPEITLHKLKLLTDFGEFYPM
jgi:hypothetical protein